MPSLFDAFDADDEKSLARQGYKEAKKAIKTGRKGVSAARKASTRELNQSRATARTDLGTAQDLASGALTEGRDAGLGYLQTGADRAIGYIDQGTGQAADAYGQALDLYSPLADAANAGMTNMAAADAQAAQNQWNAILGLANAGASAAGAYYGQPRSGR